VAKLPRNTEVITAKVLIQPGTESGERLRSYVLSALKSACRNVRDGAVAIGLYNEDGELIGLDMSGIASETMQDSIDEVFGFDDEGGT
jgi:hypothetical protein